MITTEQKDFFLKAMNNAVLAFANNEIQVGDTVTAKNSKIERKVISVEKGFVVADRTDIPFGSQPNFRSWLSPDTIKLISKAGA